MGQFKSDEWAKRADHYTPCAANMDFNAHYDSYREPNALLNTDLDADNVTDRYRDANFRINGDCHGFSNHGIWERDANGDTYRLGNRPANVNRDAHRTDINTNEHTRPRYHNGSQHTQCNEHIVTHSAANSNTDFYFTVTNG